MRRLLFLMLCICLVGLVQAELVITNGDFEADVAQTSNVTDWFDTVTATPANWWESTWAGPTVSPNGTPVMGLSYMFTTTNWAYQSIGFKEVGRTELMLSFDVGSFTDAGGDRDLGVTVSIYESDGTFVPGDNTDIDGAAGITLIDSVSTLNTLAIGALITETITLDLSTAGSGELFLRFENYAGTTGEPWTAIDNVEILTFENIQPADDPAGENPVPLSQILEWSVLLPNAELIDLYFGPENDPNLTSVPAYKKLSMEPVSTTTYTPTLDYTTSYYWKLVAYEPNTAPGATDYFQVEGPIWSFMTVGQAPAIDPVSPAYTAVEGGGVADAVMSVAGINIDTYQWYKIDDPDVMLADGADYSGTTTDTLTILGVEQADEGAYYCVVNNTVSPDPVDNRDNPGRLMTKRLVSDYPLDAIDVVDSNSFTADIVGGFDMALLSDDGGSDIPTLAAGVPELGGNSLLFNNSDSSDPNNAWAQIAQIDAGVVDYQDITITLWAYWNGGANWQRIFDFGNDTTQYMFLSPNAAGTALRFVVQNGSGEQIVETAGEILTTGEWVYLVVTLDGDTGRLYVNGELEATNTGVTADPIDFSPILNYIGKSQYADPYFNGQIDAMKIYSYARTTEQIALDYLAVKGEYVCNNEAEALLYDFDDNCQVDIADFALFAVEWLDSNRIYPAP